MSGSSGGADMRSEAATDAACTQLPRSDDGRIRYFFFFLGCLRLYQAPPFRAHAKVAYRGRR